MVTVAFGTPPPLLSFTLPPMGPGTSFSAAKLPRHNIKTTIISCLKLMFPPLENTLLLLQIFYLGARIYQTKSFCCQGFKCDYLKHQKLGLDNGELLSTRVGVTRCEVRFLSSRAVHSQASFL